MLDLFISFAFTGAATVAGCALIDSARKVSGK